MGYYNKITYNDVTGAMLATKLNAVKRGWAHVAFMDCMFDRGSDIGDKKLVISGQYHSGMTVQEEVYAEILNTALTPVEAIIGALEKRPEEKRPELLAMVRSSLKRDRADTPNYRQKETLSRRVMDDFIVNYGGQALLEEVLRQQKQRTSQR